MEINILPSIKMTDQDFLKFSSFIYMNYGIKMNLTKKIMLESRLQKRLYALKINSFKTYFELISSAQGKDELLEMIDLVSTNKTDFFREYSHFDYLSQKILPLFTAKKVIRIWSAGCSSGEEPYTIAMVLSEFILKNGFIDYHITATDISISMLQKGTDAIYGLDRVTGIPLELRMRYFLKSKNILKPTVRIIPEIRRKVIFQRLNFMDENYSEVTGSFDIIFCRNTIIYFDRKTQEQVINRLCRKLQKGGILFLGHSESINDLKVPLEQIRPTIFRKI
jgi:chemotaxis protein methyltransferase CheR